MQDDLKTSSMSAPRYTGIATLLRTPLVRDLSRLDIALIGVPFDGGVENRPGQRHGPQPGSWAMSPSPFSAAYRRAAPIRCQSPLRLK